MGELILESPGENFTLELGKRIGTMLRPGDVLALRGELGAGKTLITRGIARGLGVPPDVPITSPSFTFMNEYEGRLHLYHLDLYRLGDPDELETLPWREALFGSGVAVIEWPERMGESLPEDRWEITLTVTGDETRTITLTAHGVNRGQRFEEWSAALAPTSLP